MGDAVAAGVPSRARVSAQPMTRSAPLVILGGPAMSGKTTVADALARRVRAERRVAPAPTVVSGPGLSEDDQPTGSLAPKAGRPSHVFGSLVNRADDLELLHAASGRSRPMVIESATLPLLLQPDNDALIVRLTARLPIRVNRVRATRPAMSAGAARACLRSRDAITRNAFKATWGADLDAVGACQWRADLVVGCPEVQNCGREDNCEAAVIELVGATYAVYECFLHPAPRLSAITTARERLRELTAEHHHTFSAAPRFCWPRRATRPVRRRGVPAY